MWLLSEPLGQADIDNPKPGLIIAGNIGVDLGSPFKASALVLMRVLGPDDAVEAGALYMLDDGDDVAIVRLLDQSTDLWVVEQFAAIGHHRRRSLSRKRWQPRAAISVN